MKKTLTLLTAFLLAVSLSAQILYQREDLLTTTGYFLSGPRDLVIDNTGGWAVGLNEIIGTQAGAAVVKTDLLNGATFSGKKYEGIASHPMTGERILAVGGDYYMIANYTSNTGTLGFVKISGSTGAVLFSRNLTNSMSGQSPSAHVVDFDYDGSGYFYVLGDYDNAGQSDLWLAKLDMLGNIIWRKLISQTALDNEEAQNIFFYQNNAIYIGAISSPQANPLWRKGVIIQVDNNGTFLQAKDFAWFTFPAPFSERMSAFTVKRKVDFVYVVAQTIIGPDGPGWLCVAKLNLSTLTPITHSIYYPGSFVTGTGFLNGEFIFGNNNIIVPGISSQMNTGTPGFVNAFFDMNTNFTNANRLLNLNPGLFGNTISAVDASYNVFSYADNSNSNVHQYRFKGAPGTANTSCDNAYSLTPDPHALIMNPLTFSLGSAKNQTMTNFICNMSTISFTVSTPCYYDPWMQRIAPGPGSNVAGAGQGEAFAELYPNPSHDQLQLQVSGIAGGYRISVVDATGRLVMESAGNADTAVTLDVSGLAEGVYVIQVSGDDGHVLTKKFMRN